MQPHLEFVKVSKNIAIITIYMDDDARLKIINKLYG